MTYLRDIFLLIARVILGVVLIAHGWQKYNEWTVAGTGQNFEKMGVPMPELSAQFMTFFEIGGGVLLILGLLVRLVGPILFVAMMGAAWFAHRDSGLFASDGGWELVAVIGAAGLALAAAGAGRISLDYLFGAPFRKRKATKQAKRDEELRHEGAHNAQYAGAGVAGAGAAGAGAGAAGHGLRNNGADHDGANRNGAHNNAANNAAHNGGVDAQRDYSDERTEQINVGDAQHNQQRGFDQQGVDQRTQQFGADQRGFDQRGIDQQQAPRNVDGDAPTTQWPGNTRKQ